MGARHVDRLAGDDLSKQRLAAILRTLSGELSVEEACAELAIGEAQFHRLRERALQGALAELAPKPRGRPPRQTEAEASRVQELEAEVDELKVDLRAAQLREEIALVMPHLLTEQPEKKTERNRRRRRRQRRQKK